MGLQGNYQLVSMVAGQVINRFFHPIASETEGTPEEIIYTLFMICLFNSIRRHSVSRTNAESANSQSGTPKDYMIAETDPDPHLRR